MSVAQDKHGKSIIPDRRLVLMTCPRLISLCLAINPGSTYLLLSLQFNALNASLKTRTLLETRNEDQVG